MSAKISSILLMLLCTLFTSLAQVFYKFGAPNLKFGIAGIITNYYVIAGVLFYAIGAVLLIVALKGGELSVLYPIIATSYIWVSIMSVYLFNEVMNFYKWLGIAFIIAGIIFVNVKRENKGFMQYIEPV